MPPADFTGTTTVITGAGRKGQAGEVVARAFVEAGARICLVERDVAVAQARAAELTSAGGHVDAFGCDLTDVAQVDELARRITGLAPNGVHALVCMAGGFAESGPLPDSDPAVWHRMLDVNLTTAYLTTRAMLPLLRRTRGAVLYFASAAALPGANVARMAAYAAAKSGLVTLMRAVAAEERESGVRANAIAPTAIRTAANIAAMGDRTTFVEREIIAAWAVWLCSPNAGPVTGQVIRLG